MNSVVTLLPAGCFINGSHWREAQLQALTGEDQLHLAEECRGLLPAEWVTEALARCVTRLGPDRPTRETIRSLTLGDREALLLRVRSLTTGDRLPCVLTCPSPGCHEKLDLELSIADLLVPQYANVCEQYERTVSGTDGLSTVIRFRLPTGSDQETCAALARSNMSAAVDSLARRCIQSAVSPDGSGRQELSPVLVEQLSACMAELDIQAEITLHVQCTGCGGAINVIFDTAGYMMQELAGEMRTIYHEVHLLAYHYHWSAAEILGMSAPKRRRFLRLLEDELQQETIQ